MKFELSAHSRLYHRKVPSSSSTVNRSKLDELCPTFRKSFIFHDEQTDSTRWKRAQTSQTAQSSLGAVLHPALQAAVNAPGGLFGRMHMPAAIASVACGKYTDEVSRLLLPMYYHILRARSCRWAHFSNICSGHSGRVLELMEDVSKL